MFLKKKKCNEDRSWPPPNVKNVTLFFWRLPLECRAYSTPVHHKVIYISDFVQCSKVVEWSGVLRLGLLERVRWDVACARYWRLLQGASPFPAVLQDPACSHFCNTAASVVHLATNIREMLLQAAACSYSLRASREYLIIQRGWYTSLNTKHLSSFILSHFEHVFKD